MGTGVAFTRMLKQRLATPSLYKDAAFGGSEALSRIVQCVCVFLCVCVCVKTGIVAHRVLHFHCWNWSEQEECSFKTLRVPFAIRKCKRRNTVGDCGCLENSRGALMLAVRAGFSTLALRGHSHWVGWGPWKLRSERIARVLCRIFIGETTDSGRANGLGSDVDETL